MYFWLIVIGSAVWVLVDAKNIGVRKNLISGMGNMGPWSWFFVTLLLWIVGLPMYLYCRGKFKLAVAKEVDLIGVPTSASAMTHHVGARALDDLEKLASLKDKGLVSESEFEAKKKQLLGL